MNKFINTLWLLNFNVIWIILKLLIIKMYFIQTHNWNSAYNKHNDRTNMCTMQTYLLEHFWVGNIKFPLYSPWKNHDYNTTRF